VVVFADDVQWLDSQTQETLTIIARRVQETGLVVIGAVRNGHGGPFVTAGFRELSMRGVNDTSAERILLSHAGDLGAAARSQIRQVASGNPLTLHELPALWRGPDAPTSDQQPLPLTARWERAFAGRTAELPDVTRDAVLVAAVDGSDDVFENSRSRGGAQAPRRCIGRPGAGGAGRAAHGLRRQRRVQAPAGALGRLALGDRPTQAGGERGAVCSAGRPAVPPNVDTGPSRSSGRTTR
jgi:hypothetical protein